MEKSIAALLLNHYNQETHFLLIEKYIIRIREILAQESCSQDAEMLDHFGLVWFGFIAEDVCTQRTDNLGPQAFFRLRILHNLPLNCAWPSPCFATLGLCRG